MTAAFPLAAQDSLPGAPAPRAGAGRTGPAPGLSGRQKAAVLIRLLAREGIDLPLAQLPDDMQAALAEEVGRMRHVDRATVDAVLEEFLSGVEDIGLSFPEGLPGALTLLEPHLSPAARHRLRLIAGEAADADPWARIVGLDSDRLLPLVLAESPEVAAVLMSKLPVARAAALLGRVPGDRARRIAYGVSLTGKVDPATVLRIGRALAAQLEAQPVAAFDEGPVERVGAMLNASAATTRDEVLEGLEAEDESFAQEVRRAIFTFANIPVRIDPRDIPKVLRRVDQAVLTTALAGATGREAASTEFILSNISQRMAAALREEMAGRSVKPKEAEEAQAGIVAAIRDLEAAGELFLVSAEET